MWSYFSSTRIHVNFILACKVKINLGIFDWTKVCSYVYLQQHPTMVWLLSNGVCYEFSYGSCFVTWEISMYTFSNNSPFKNVLFISNCCRLIANKTFTVSLSIGVYENNLNLLCATFDYYSRFFVFLYDSLISWKSTKQGIVS